MNEAINVNHKHLSPISSSSSSTRQKVRLLQYFSSLAVIKSMIRYFVVLHPFAACLELSMTLCLVFREFSFIVKLYHRKLNIYELGFKCFPFFTRTQTLRFRNYAISVFTRKENGVARLSISLWRFLLQLSGSF